MNISKDIKPITYLKSKAPDLLKQINETHRPVVITQVREPKAVLQDPESYENMRNAIGILKLISQGEQDVKDGKSKSQEEVFANVGKLLKKQNEMKQRYDVSWSETAERDLIAIIVYLADDSPSRAYEVLKKVEELRFHPAHISGKRPYCSGTSTARNHSVP